MSSTTLTQEESLTASDVRAVVDAAAAVAWSGAGSTPPVLGAATDDESAMLLEVVLDGETVAVIVSVDWFEQVDAICSAVADVLNAVKSLWVENAEVALAVAPRRGRSDVPASIAQSC